MFTTTRLERLVWWRTNLGFVGGRAPSIFKFKLKKKTFKNIGSWWWQRLGFVAFCRPPSPDHIADLTLQLLRRLQTDNPKAEIVYVISPKHPRYTEAKWEWLQSLYAIIEREWDDDHVQHFKIPLLITDYYFDRVHLNSHGQSKLRSWLGFDALRMSCLGDRVRNQGKQRQTLDWVILNEA